MTRRLLALATGVIAALGAAAPALATSTADYVVVFREGLTGADATTDALERARGFTASRRYSAALGGFAARLSAEQVTRLEADPRVAYVTPDIEVLGDGVDATPSRETVPTGVRRVRAADEPAAGAAVAVLDTGLDLNNRELTAVDGANCVKPGSPAKDDNGHGTHVGGTIAGSDDGRGVVGVAPGAPLYAVKVLDRKGGGSLSGILCGLDWVAERGADLGIRAVNMSLGAPGRDDGACGRVAQDALHAAVCRVVAAGVTVVASAGNSGAPIGAVAPASYAEALTVAGMTDTDGAPGGGGPEACVDGELDDTAWTGSNFGTTAADAAHLVAAPGTCVVSTKRGGGTLTMTGTSMAAPHVTGAVARCVGTTEAPGPCAGLSPGAIIDRLQADAEEAGTTGFGFAGDPLAPLTSGRLYGPLVDASY